MSGRGDGGGPTIRDGLATTISTDMASSGGCQYPVLLPIRQRQNQIRCLRVGDWTVRDQAFVGEALAADFRKFYQQGPQSKWRWTPTTAFTLPPLL